MSDAIGPGDFVECIDATGAAVLQAGAVYQVREVWTCAEGLRWISVGVGEPPEGWYPSRFRPVYRPKAEVIEEMKRMVGAPLREPIDA